MRFRTPLATASNLNNVPLSSLVRQVFDGKSGDVTILRIVESARSLNLIKGEDRGLFIEVLIQGLPSGQFVLGERIEGRALVIDGAARLYAIRDFMDDDYPVPTPTGSLYYSEFDATERRHFENVMVAVWRYSGLRSDRASALRNSNGSLVPVE